MGSAKTAGALSGAASGAQAGAAAGPWGAAIGAVVGGAIGYFGSKDKQGPQLAPYEKTDIRAAQKTAIDANLQNFDGAATLSSRTNTFNQSESARALERAMPGFSAIQARLLSEVNKDLDSQNNLPREVQDQLAQFAAEKGVTRGTSGNFNAFSLVKDFGFNLIDWRNASRARALNTLSQVYGMAPRVNVMSPMASMVDPSTAIQVTQRNNEFEYNRQQSKLNADTKFANDEAEAMNGALQGSMSSFGSTIGGFGGGMGGGMGGAQGKVSKAPDNGSYIV